MYLSTEQIKNVFNRHDLGKIEEIKLSDISLTINVGQDLFGNSWTQILFTKGIKDLGMLFKISDKKTNSLYTAECFNNEYRREFEESVRKVA